jgi:hypothetical protein
MNQFDGLVGGDGYAFAQQDSILEVVFPVSPKTTVDDIEFSLDPDTREV